MVGKLALMSVGYDANPEDRPTNRDEIKQVIVDTLLLASGAVPLERWLEGEQDRVFRARR